MQKTCDNVLKWGGGPSSQEPSPVPYPRQVSLPSLCRRPGLVWGSSLSASSGTLHMAGTGAPPRGRLLEAHSPRRRNLVLIQFD